MALRREAFGLVSSLAVALAVQIPMFPGLGLEARDLSGYAPWMTIISLVLFFPLLALAVAAIPLAWRHTLLSGRIAVVFAVGMIPITVIDMAGLAGPQPSTTILGFEIAAIVTFGAILFYGLRLLAYLGDTSARRSPAAV